MEIKNRILEPIILVHALCIVMTLITLTPAQNPSISCSGICPGDSAKLIDFRYDSLKILKSFSVKNYDSSIVSTGDTSYWVYKTIIDTVYSTSCQILYTFDICLQYTLFDPNNSLYNVAIDSLTSHESTPPMKRNWIIDSTWGELTTTSGMGKSIYCRVSGPTTRFDKAYLKAVSVSNSIELHSLPCDVTSYPLNVKKICNVDSLVKKLQGKWNWLFTQVRPYNTQTDPGDVGHHQSLIFSSTSYRLLKDTTDSCSGTIDISCWDPLHAKTKICLSSSDLDISLISNDFLELSTRTSSVGELYYFVRDGAQLPILSVQKSDFSRISHKSPKSNLIMHRFQNILQFSLCNQKIFNNTYFLISRPDGRIILYRRIISGQSTITIDDKALSTGVYIATFKFGKYFISKQFTITK